MPSRGSGEGEKPRLTFTLVHGTFARRADWVLDDEDVHDFRSKLRTALPGYDVAFDAEFRWHAKDRLRIADNTIAARQSAAARLEEHILGAEPALGGRHYVVAHSHGGNVAMYALRNPEVRARVDGLICLATPFLFSKPAPFDRSLLGFSALLWFVLALNAASWWMWALFVAYAVLVLLVGFTRKHEVPNGLEQICEHLDLTNPPKDISTHVVGICAHLEKVKLPTQQELTQGPSDTPVLVVRASRDEVYWMLTVARRAGKMLRAVWAIINRVGAKILAALIVVALARGVIESNDLPIGLERINDVTSLVDRFVMTPMLIAASAVLAAIVTMRWFFAFDAVRWVTTLDTWTDDVPWPDADPPIESRAVDANETAKGLLRHSRVQSSAVAFIAELVAKTG